MEATVVPVGGAHGTTTPPALRRWARTCAWLLPVWAVLLAASTVTHQPDYETDFDAYARYVTTTWFLVSHLLFSIVGAALGAVGAMAVGVSLAASPAARPAVWGASAFAASQVVTAAVFGAAAFVQPAIGRAHLDGDRASAEALNSDVYGPELFAAVSSGLVVMVVGAALLGHAAVRSGIAPRWAGRVLAWGTPAFIIAGFSFQVLQPVAGVVLAAGGAALARALSAPSSRHQRQE